MQTPNSTPERIKALRKRKLLEAEELAKICDFSPATMYRIEKGQSSLNEPQLLKLADALGVTVNFLVGREDLELELDAAVIKQALRIFLESRKVERKLANLLWEIADKKAGPASPEGWGELCHFVTPTKPRRGPSKPIQETSKMSVRVFRKRQ